ncbi:MAG: hypothetical protein FWC13_09815 [Oscillospiraceae bacterium]|nr:hypothetical protein [Oscillospiraceae bacterium]
MSGMFDAKPDKAARKQALTQKEEKARKKRRTLTIIICIVFVLVLAASIVLNSDFIRQTLPVVTIDGRDFTTAEFEFFFNTVFQDIATQFQGMIPMPDPNRSLSAQIFNEETGETWSDFITGMAFDRMAGTISLYNAAMDYGFTLSQDDLTMIESQIMMLGFEASMHGFPNTQSYMQRIFGFSINEQIYREMLEFILTAELFNSYIRDSFSFTQAQLNEYYAENADTLDVFTFRSLTISPEIPFFDESEDEIDEEGAVAQALADAHERADEIASSITDEESFLAAAEEYNEIFADPASTIRESRGEFLDADISEWLLDSERQAGDTTVLHTDHGGVIFLFVSRNAGDYRTVSMNQILILRETIDSTLFDLGTDDPEYIEAAELANEEASNRAQEVYALFTVGETTVDALIELMEEHSDDTTPAGFYENIAMSQYHGATFSAMRVVPEIEEWLFDEARAIGDFALISTVAHGYHLIVFAGFGDYLSNLIADDRMRSSAHSEWNESLEVGQPQRHGAFILVST